jgi:signal transduction histidine kinase
MRRLRWQLTLSHLVAIAITLVSMIAAVVFLATAFLASQTNTSREAAQDARLVAESISGVVTRGDQTLLSPILSSIADGSLRVVAPFGPPGENRRPGFFGPNLRNVAYIVLLGPDGQPLASSDATGAAFAPPERAQWPPLASQVQASGRPGDDSSVQVAGGPGALGAAPVFDDAGRAVGTVIVATAGSGTSTGGPAGVFGGASTGGSPGLFGALAFFGAASLAVLAAASLFALVSSSLVAYVLAGRLVRRLERLGQAVETFAAGDLASRARDDGQDEVGQLSRRFNRMADDLAGTLHELQSERDRVSGLLEARQQLVAGVSHELRTPVATMRGYLEAAVRSTFQVSARSDLETIERELSRLERLIEDLFTLSSAEVGRLALRLEPVDLSELVRRVVDTHAPLAWNQRRVQVLAELPPHLPAARADAQRVEQIVSNLLSNAIRHTPPGGLVAATAAFADGTVSIEVRDTGDGIAPEDLPHVFERFYRGRGEDARAGQGLGLGLNLVKELAEAMGGSAEVSSAPGEGSCFSVELPRA